MKKSIKLLVAATALLSMGLVGCDSETTDDPGTNGEGETIKVEKVALNKTEASIYVGKFEFLKATITPENASNKALEWSSDNDEIAMVGSNGKVVGISAGTTKIKCASKEDPTKFAECTVTVSIEDTTVHVTDVTLDKTSASIYTGESLQLNASVLPENASVKDLVWSSSAESVAVVTNTGNVAALSAGTAKIKVASKEKPEIYKECAVTVTVKDTSVHVTKVEVISEKSINLDLGGTTTAHPSVRVTPENATNKALTWTSSDPSKVVVDSTTGAITAIGETTQPVTITVTSNDDSTKKDTIQVSVDDTRDDTVHVDTVTLQETLSLDIKDGAKSTITAQISPSNAWNKKINWVSSDSSTVKLTPIGDNSVSVEGLKVGSATITATSEDGNKASTCAVTVTDSIKHVTAVSVKQDGQEIENIDIYNGQLASLNASVVPDDADNGNVVWSMESGAEEYITLAADSGASQTIVAKKITTNPVKVRATSAENSTIYKEFNVSVLDPTVYATGVSIKANGDEITSATIEVGANKTGITLDGASLPDNVTTKGVDWSIFTTGGNEYISLTHQTTDENQITVKGLKVTTSPIVVRATSKSDPTKYKDVEISVIIPANVDRFSNFELPSDIQKYKLATTASNLNSVTNIYDKSNANMPAQFFEVDAEHADDMTYVVGDQGVFEFKPTASIYKAGENTPTVISNPSINKKLYKFNTTTSEYDLVDMDDYADVDGNRYDFKDAAVGNKFKLNITPGNEYYCESAVEPINFEFKVITGYNVDTLAELSLFDNCQAEWTDYKNAVGLNGVTANGGIILHKDIQVSSDIIPSAFKWSQTAVEEYIAQNPSDFEAWWQAEEFETADAGKEAFIGSIIDYYSIFERNTSNGDFSFNGNFFSVDASQLKPVCMMMMNDNAETLMAGFQGDGSHAQLFGMNPDWTKIPTAMHSVSMKNVMFRGNGGLDRGEMGKGGLIMLKAGFVNLQLENVVSTSSFITFLLNNETWNPSFYSSMTADRIYCSDSYSSSFYMFGTNNNTISNSFLAKCGGPIFILDEAQKQFGQTASCDCYNVYAHNYVTGMEPWFVSHPGSQGLAQSYLIDPGNINSSTGWIAQYSQGVYNAAPESMRKSLGKTTAMNKDGLNFCDFIAVEAYLGQFDSNVTYDLGGHFTINNGGNSASMLMSDVLRTGSAIPTAGNGTAIVPSTIANPIYKSSNGGVAYINQVPSPSPVYDNAFGGDYCSVYLAPAMLSDVANAKYMGVMLGMFDLPGKTN